MVTGAMQQFVGAVIEAVSATERGAITPEVSFQLRLRDGSTRDLDLYAIGPAYEDESGVSVRIDGQYVPSEEL